MLTNDVWCVKCCSGMHRGGALFATGASELSIEGVHFTRLGGNAVMLSEYVRNTSFHSCEFSWVGDSGIGQMGSVKVSVLLTSDFIPRLSFQSLTGIDGIHAVRPNGHPVAGVIGPNGRDRWRAS